MPRLSDRALVLQQSAIRKLDLLVARQEDVRFHRVNIGQPDVPTPPALLRAASSFQPDVLAYGPASGTMACREAAAAYNSKWCPDIEPFDIAVTTGGSEALLFAFTAICDPGDEIIVFEPYYTNYNGFATVAGARIVPVRTELEDGFAIPSDRELDAVVTAQTRAVVFSNPCNPTGSVYDRESLERLGRWAARHDLFVVADEVYRRIFFEEAPTSFLQLAEFAHRTVVVDSLSKTWSACGARLGFLISRNAELMEKVERLGQARLGPQPLAQAIALAALGLPDAYYDRVRATYQRRVASLYDVLSTVAGVRVHRPKGAFYFMADLPVDDSDRFARWLVTDFRDGGESVVIAPGGGFYADPASGRTQARIAAVLDEERLARVGHLLGQALSEYPGRQ